MEIAGPLDLTRFERALRATVAEAETLHCRYTPDGPGGGAGLTIAPSPGWPLPVLDVGSEPDPYGAAEAWMRTDLAVPVDLAAGPLFGHALFRLGENRFLWYQRVHHIALDGFGLVLLIRRVAARYTALVAGAPPAGRPFGPLAAVLDEDHGYVASPDFERDQAFWTSRFGDRPAPVTLALCPPDLGESGREGFLAPHPGLTGGYLKSKWAAEHLLAQAAARGLPVAVYRLGRVTGPPTTAGVNGADVFWRLLCEVVRAGELPRVPGVAGALGTLGMPGAPGAPGGGLGGVREVWTPADYVARAVVRLSALGRATGTGAVFNLAPHPPTDLSEVFGWVADYGFAIPRLPEGLPLPARDNLPADTRPLHAGPAARAVAATGAHCPRIDRELVHRYLDTCVRTGLLPPPGRF